MMDAHPIDKSRLPLARERESVTQAKSGARARASSADWNESLTFPPCSCSTECASESEGEGACLVDSSGETNSVIIPGRWTTLTLEQARYDE